MSVLMRIFIMSIVGSCLSGYFIGTAIEMKEHPEIYNHSKNISPLGLLILSSTLFVIMVFIFTISGIKVLGY